MSIVNNHDLSWQCVVKKKTQYGGGFLCVFNMSLRFFCLPQLKLWDLLIDLITIANRASGKQS